MNNESAKRRQLPDGIPSFEMIRRDGYVYVDKTDLVWQLVHRGMFNYLSRPRRFGKSLLVDTLACYFEGKRELFEGLKIMELEKEWKKYPVIRFDMSEAGATEGDVKDFFDKTFLLLEEEFGVETKGATNFSIRFSSILKTIYDKAGGTSVVVLIDEYDAPLQHSWHTDEHEAVAAVYRSVFACLKSCAKYEKFVFLTGITKFTQISLFSVLNNLANVSFMPQFAAICGITKQEVTDNFMPEIGRMACENGMTTHEAVEALQAKYDGYHFSSRNMVDVYNPFSLVRALADGVLGFYWAYSGANSLLPKFVDNMELRVRDLDNVYVSMGVLESSDVTGGAELFLYQSGYLTIKDFDGMGYTLGIPNQEVRQALYEVVIPALTMRGQNEVRTAQFKLLRHMNYGEVDDAMKTLKALVADVPYSNKKLESMDMEERYRFIISSIFYAIGLSTEVEHMMAKGRIDILAKALHAIYVIELKLTKNGGLDAAERQIRDNLYAEPFKADGREVIPLAVELDDEGKGILKWRRG